MGQPAKPLKTTQRGLGWEHQKIRARLLPKAYGRPCPLCGEVMLREQRLHLDHSLPRSQGGRHGDRIVHGWCNESRGDGSRERLRTSRSW